MCALVVKDLQSAIQKLDSRVKVLEVTASAGPRPVPSAAPAPKPTPSKAQVQDDEDDGVDLFASDSEVIKCFRTLTLLQVFAKHLSVLKFCQSLG